MTFLDFFSLSLCRSSRPKRCRHQFFEFRIFSTNFEFSKKIESDDISFLFNISIKLQKLNSNREKKNFIYLKTFFSNSNFSNFQKSSDFDQIFGIILLILFDSKRFWRKNVEKFNRFWIRGGSKNENVDKIFGSNRWTDFKFF